MLRKAIITVKLVPEANQIANRKRLAREIRESLKCDRLFKVERVSIETSAERHHAMPSGDEVVVK